MFVLRSDVLVIKGRNFKTSAICMKTAKVGDEIVLTKILEKPHRGAHGLNASKYILQNLTNGEKHIVTESILINTLNSFIF